MTVKSDRWIKRMAEEEGMIRPFVGHQVSDLVISYGLSSYGYDIRVASDFRVFTAYGGLIDPKDFNPRHLLSVEAVEYIDLPPHSFALASSVEWFKLPRNILCIFLTKSTLARCGLVVGVTPLEPEWEGYITLELSNTTPRPMRVYANEGIGQVLFLEGDEECEFSYNDRRGKYQKQQGIVYPRVK